MKKIAYTPVLLAVTLFLAACGSVPRSTGLLETTRVEFGVAQSNPAVAKYAGVEMKQATEAMGLANAASARADKPEEIDKLAYLAKQKIALTQEVAKQKSAEADVATSGKERDQIRLDQRTAEANKANASAEQSKATALAAQLQTADAQRKAQEAQAHAAQLQAQLADLAAKKTERGTIITLGDVLFGVDVAALNSEGMRSAQKLADVLQQNPGRTVLVEGYTDNTGSMSHNQDLSERRAASVRIALQGMGVAGTRVTTRGYGQANPVAANDTAANRQLNRRVEIVLSDDAGKVSQR